MTVSERAGVMLHAKSRRLGCAGGWGCLRQLTTPPNTPMNPESRVDQDNNNISCLKQFKIQIVVLFSPRE